MRSRFRFSCSWLSIQAHALDLDDGKLLPDEHHLCLLKWLRSSIHRALATSHTQAAPLSDPNLVKENLRAAGLSGCDSESRVGE